MTKWISVKDRLPDEGSIVKIKLKILFIPTKAENIRAFYFKKYFNVKGENLTKWVTHWLPLTDEVKIRESLGKFKDVWDKAEKEGKAE